MSIINLDELRATYQAHLQSPVPQRARGIPYQKIIGPSGLFWLFSAFFIIPPLLLVFHIWQYVYSTPFIILYSLFTYLFLGFPAEFYDEKKLIKRWARKAYPHIYKTIYRFKERAKLDRMIVGPRLLWIEGKGYFLGVYARQLFFIENRATLTGFFLLNEQGQLVDDEELFVKAFLTYNYGIIGAISGQNAIIGDRWALTEKKKIYAPRSEKVLQKMRRYFEENGYLHEFQELLKYIPDLYVAANDALTIIDGREKYCKAMGYSFGHEFMHEDAVKEMDMRQAFSKYMLAAHFMTLNNVRVLTGSLRNKITQDGTGWQKRIAIKSLETIWELAFMISNLIDKMAQEGVPSDDDKKLFREKTQYVKSVINNRDY